MKTKTIALIAVLILIAAAILYLESQKPQRVLSGEAEIEPLNKEKTGKYPAAKEIVNPSGFINVNKITVKELVGKKVILIDFWTYSCINCQRTTPYLNGWYEKYRDKGLEIIGVHTPEFKFEQKYENVLAAVKKFGIKYPVVQDNEYSTWTAYENRYWPRKYLIDIDGFVVYDHIGEGAYEETEKKIQELLEERAKVLKLKEEITGEITKPGISEVDFTKILSPEIYFGAARNDHLGNGKPNTRGLQSLIEPDVIELNTLYIAGDWDFQDEFAESKGQGKIIFKYNAKSVHLVASAEDTATIRILRNGKPLESEAGIDVVKRNGARIINVSEARLYNLIEDPAGYGEHTLEIIVETPGLRAFTFTFG